MTEQKPAQEDHSRVIPTAWGVAYLRTLTDIPMMPEFFDVLEKHLADSDEPAGAWREAKDKLAPQLEARYKLVNRLLENSGATQIIEVAAGLSPRGFNLATAQPEVNYVEVDLPGVIREKRNVLAGLDVINPANLKLVEGNALDAQSLLDAAALLESGQPFAVINEGLMRYLKFPDKAAYAKNIRKLLGERGGVWITPDISLRSALAREDEVVGGHIKSLASATGINILENVFEDEGHARDFFRSLGFNIERHSFLEVSNELVSPARLGMTPKEVERLNDQSVAFVLSLK